MKISKLGASGIALGGIFAAIIGTGTASATGLIGSNDIQDNSIQSQDVADDSLQSRDVRDHTLALKDIRATAIAGLTGKDGTDGRDGLAGAFYATAYYDAGDTNAGAVATVACDPDSSAFTAISGGVQTLALDETPLDNNTPVSSSFPGRMDWNTNSPKADRLDGWIVQFGGNAGPQSDVAPGKVKVWALCVPSTDIAVKSTYQQSIDG